MLLTISTTHQPATDLGYLLHKHPSRVHQRDLSFGTASVVYSEVSAERCTASLLVEVDPVRLVRGRKGTPRGRELSLGHYVNDRPYTASSLLSVAIAKTLGTALGGRSRERPELAATPIPLEAHLPVVPVRGDDALIGQLLVPLGYEVTTKPVPLDGRSPDLGDSRYVDLRLAAVTKLGDLLEHLFVLLPVLDDDKHYWVGGDEVDKLLHRAGGWLADHPARELITRRYLRHDRRLTRDALARLLADTDHAAGDIDPDRADTEADAAEEAVERPLSLNEQRLAAVVDQVEKAGADSVVDLGCGDGKLLRRLVQDTAARRIVGVDVSHRALDRAARRLRLDQAPPRQRERIDLWHGALTYRDDRIAGFDVATVVEVIEHIDPPRLDAFERAVFGAARPGTVIITTPNAEYNVRFEGLAAGALRHRDHRFEWTRAELATWAAAVAERHGYTVAHLPIGPHDPEVGAPTQMVVFSQ